MSQLDEQDMFNMLEKYQTNRDTCKKMYVNLMDPIVEGVFYVNLAYLASIPYLRKDEQPDLDIFSNSKSLFKAKKRFFNQIYREWVLRRTMTITTMLFRPERIPLALTQEIADWVEESPGEVLLTAKQFKKLNFLRLSKLTCLLGCISCSISPNNYLWDIKNTTFEQLVEHSHSDEHLHNKNKKPIAIDW